jgi:hypothetical protein
MLFLPGEYICVVSCCHWRVSHKRERRLEVLLDPRGSKVCAFQMRSIVSLSVIPCIRLLGVWVALEQACQQGLGCCLEIPSEWILHLGSVVVGVPRLVCLVLVLQVRLETHNKLCCRGAILELCFITFVSLFSRSLVTEDWCFFMVILGSCFHTCSCLWSTSMLHHIVVGECLTSKRGNLRRF